MTAELVQLTTYISIFIQFLTGFFGAIGLKYNLPIPHKILGDALKLEMIVQTIEFVFYVWLITYFSLQKMALIRYYDWFITTPMMLFATMLVYEYLIQVETNKDTKLTFTEFIKKYKKIILSVVLSNFVMLFAGYLGELGIISPYIATIIGFIALAVSFMIIYNNFAYQLQNKEKILYYLLVIFWSLYGIAYLFPVAIKNISYNFLDIIAKNFFGLYLYYKIVKVSKGLKI
jgi:bacteriorhodopsin